MESEGIKRLWSEFEPARNCAMNSRSFLRKGMDIHIRSFFFSISLFYHFFSCSFSSIIMHFTLDIHISASFLMVFLIYIKACNIYLLVNLCLFRAAIEKAYAKNLNAWCDKWREKINKIGETGSFFSSLRFFIRSLAIVPWSRIVLLMSMFLFDLVFLLKI